MKVHNIVCSHNQSHTSSLCPQKDPRHYRLQLSDVPKLLKSGHLSSSYNLQSTMMGMFFDVFVHFIAYFVCPFTPGSAEAHCVRWELERLFDGQLCHEYSYQKLLKCDNPFQGILFWETVYMNQLSKICSLFGMCISIESTLTCRMIHRI